MSDICHLCFGAGNFFVCQEMPEFSAKRRWFHWFACSNCNGLGTVRVHSSPFIRAPGTKGKSGLGKKLEKIARAMVQREIEGSVK